MRKESLPFAISFSLLASLSYATLTSLIQILEEFLFVGVIIFFQQFFALLILLPLISFKSKPYSSLKTKVFHLHLLRTLSSVVAMFCLYVSIHYLPVTDAIILSYTRPLFIPLVILVWFKIKWTKNTYTGLILGFLGVTLIVGFGLIKVNLYSLLALTTACIGAIGFTTISRLAKTESPEQIVFYYLVLSIPIVSISLLVNCQIPSTTELYYLVLIGIAAIFFQLFLARAYRYAGAVKVTCLLYFTVPFTYVIDYFLGKKDFSLVTFCGVAIIILGSIIVIREQKLPQTSSIT